MPVGAASRAPLIDRAGIRGLRTALKRRATPTSWRATPADLRTLKQHATPTASRVPQDRLADELRAS
jgi:hypothetical protein